MGEVTETMFMYYTVIIKITNIVFKEAAAPLCVCVYVSAVVYV